MGSKYTEDRLEPKMVEIADGNYVLKGKMVEAHKLSPEWVAQENPDIIIKLVRGSKFGRIRCDRTCWIKGRSG